MIETVTRKPNVDELISEILEPRPVMDIESAYYRALFRRDYPVAKVYYRQPELQAKWEPDRLIREAHKCGIYDEADKEL